MMKRAILCALLAALAVPADAKGGEEKATFKKLRNEIGFKNSRGRTEMHYPEVLSEALVVYIGCTVRSAGLSFRRYDSDVVLEADYGRNCTEERQQARKQSIAVLQAEGIVTPEYQKIIVDESLAVIDQNAAVWKDRISAQVGSHSIHPLQFAKKFSSSSTLFGSGVKIWRKLIASTRFSLYSAPIASSRLLTSS